ncbi:MAG: hypothetical protein QOK17_2537 [Sphingomonadales bacterium]|nr:hypothetical protein [Sphingomonadales bacterium]
MGMPLYASAPTADGRWFGLHIHPSGWILQIIPGLFSSKAESDANAKRQLGPRR